ncbi:MAG TPA: DegT/DnrJ/EryC1/StrS family aminotransferase, partial [Gammaproteobacteria bacterium]
CEAESRRHVYHQYTILLPEGVNRNGIMEYLNARAIASAVYYPVPLHRQNAFSEDECSRVRLPVTESIVQRCLSLPIYPEMTEAQIQHVCESVVGALDEV